MVNALREVVERRLETAKVPPPPRCLSLAHRYGIEAGVDVEPDLSFDFTDKYGCVAFAVELKHSVN